MVDKACFEGLAGMVKLGNGDREPNSLPAEREMIR